MLVPIQTIDLAVIAAALCRVLLLGNVAVVASITNLVVLALGIHNVIAQGVQQKSAP